MSKFKIGSGTHKMELIDSGSGIEIEFEYRLPTNNERIKYQKDAMKSKGKKLVMATQAAARKHALPLIQAFRFTSEEPDTRLNLFDDTDKLMGPLSCTPGDPGYQENWREIIGKYLPGIVEVLGNRLFSGVQDAGLDIVFDADVEEPDAGMDPPQ